MKRGPTPTPPLRFNAAMSINHCAVGLRPPPDSTLSRVARHARGEIGIGLRAVAPRGMLNRMPRIVG